MALQGTIKDFALPDIFQLIGIQRKTGILTLESGQDTVTIKFLDGQVVGADTKSETLEGRLGELLVRTGRITQAQLEESLRVQRNTLQRLGHILVRAGRISEEELVEALRVQSSQIIYRLFRWRDGTYAFDKVEDLEYDQNHFVPISSETILMEGARMIDEWPIIERRIGSDSMVLRRTEAAQVLCAGVESVLSGSGDFSIGVDHDRRPQDSHFSDPQEGQIKLSAEEREILLLVDGKRSVRDVCDLLTLGEFDTFRILSEMLTRQLVEQVRQLPAEGSVDPRTGLLTRIRTWLSAGALMGLALLGLFTLNANPLTPWARLARAPMSDQLRTYTSMARLEKIERAVQVFYLDNGTFPRSLVALAQNGYVAPDDLLDPWGRAYQFELSKGGYHLLGWDAEGSVRPELTVSRRFNSAQHMMTAGEDME